jgi:hypothetical protein
VGLAVARPPQLIQRLAFRLLLAAALGGAVSIFAIAAHAARPTAGCWGTCGGPQGPVGGYFSVSGGKVTGFEDTQACLGKTTYGTDYLRIARALNVSSAGAFSYSGSAEISDISSPKVIRSVSVKLSGTFTTPKSATVTLTITSCGTKHLTILDRT